MTHTYCNARKLKGSSRLFEHLKMHRDIISLLLKRITLREIEPLKGNIIFYLTISRVVLVTISQLVDTLCGGDFRLWLRHSESCGTSHISASAAHKSRHWYFREWQYSLLCKIKLPYVGCVFVNLQWVSMWAMLFLYEPALRAKHRVRQASCLITCSYSEEF